MKSLQQHLADYITARRALGARLNEQAKTLSTFIKFLARNKARFITVDLALEWSQQSKGVQRATWARKLSMVRQFAHWMSVIEPRHQVPPRRLLEVRHRRSIPYIYSDQEIAQLIAEASKVKSRTGMKALALQTLIGLLAATGLRPGEAAALKAEDVDLQDGVLVIRESKFGKSRQVPMHSSAIAALKQYVQQRDRILGGSICSYFLVWERGKRLDLRIVRKWFCKISKACGLRTTTEGHRCGRGPRFQDLRHTFATRRLVEWYRAGSDVTTQMPKLSTYLGHSSVSCTYWYIQAVPELLEMATDFELAQRQGGPA